MQGEPFSAALPQCHSGSLSLYENLEFIRAIWYNGEFGGSYEEYQPQTIPMPDGHSPGRWLVAKRVPKTRGDRAASVAVVASYGHSQIHIYTHGHIHGNAGTDIYIPTSAHRYLVASRYLSTTGGVHVHAPAAHLHTGARHSYPVSYTHLTLPTTPYV